MRLIDADTLCKKIRKIYDGYMMDECGCCPLDFENMVDEQPTAYNEVKTNADYIRNMTDEELAEFILSITEDGVYNTIIDDYCFNDSKEILNWLKAEREG